MSEWIKTRYRIFHDGDNSCPYHAQVWRWWWPFWAHVDNTYAHTEKWCEEKLMRRFPRTKPHVVKYVEAPND